MALDTTNLANFLKGITNAIRAKTGSTDTIWHHEIDEEISNIKTFNDYANNIVKMLAHCDRITDFSNMFSIPELTDETLNKISAVLDTSNGTDFSSMFYGAKILTTIPAIDTSKGEYVHNMFGGCTALHTINGQLSFKNLYDDPHNININYSNTFSNCYHLTNIRFVENSIPAYGYIGSSLSYSSLDVHYSPYLTNESTNSIIKGLCQNESGKTWTLRLHSDVIKKLTDEQILEIDNKNWELG